MSTSMVAMASPKPALQPRRDDQAEPGQVRIECVDARDVCDVENMTEGPSSAEARLEPDRTSRGVGPDNARAGAE